MYPTLEKVKEIAASGEYRRIPVCKELYADRYTPVEVMRVLRKASKHCYLLESASQTEVWGRFSFLGYEPAMEITCTDGVLNIRKTGEDMVVTKKVEHPGDTLREIIEQYITFQEMLNGVLADLIILYEKQFQVDIEVDI